MNNQQQQQQNQQPQPVGGAPSQPGQGMPAPGQQPRFPHQMMNQGGMTQNPNMFMQQQMGQNNYYRGGAGGNSQQYRQKNGQGFNAQGGNPQQMMANPYLMQQMGGMQNFINPVSQMMMGGPMNSSTPQQKRDYSNCHSLYIGNLSSKTFDLDLYKFFKNHGYAIMGVKVIFNKETKYSKGYGYLNFYAEDEAQRCLENMNNATIDGKQIVLSKKKDKDFDSKANIVVKNLPKELDQKQMNDLFSKYGPIKSCKLEVFKDGSSRCFGYIQYEAAENAEKAIGGLNGSVHGGKTIEVVHHIKKDEREDQGEKYTNLFVQNLPADYTDKEIEALFKEYGAIESVSINVKKNGSGYVNFKDHSSANAAIEAMHMKKKLNGNAILIMPHIYRKENDLVPKSTGDNLIIQSQKQNYKSNIFVRFIPKSVTQDELKAEFEKAGDIASVKLKEHTKIVNGESFSNYQIGYVLYNDVTSAQKCIKMFDQSQCFGYNQRPLKVDFWQSKVDLQQQNQEKSEAGLKQLVNYYMRQNRPYNNNEGMQQMYGNQQTPNQAMGDNFKGNKYNNRGRGGGRGGGRGQSRGGYNKNQGGQNPRSSSQQQQYGNNKQMNNQGAPMGMPQADGMGQQPGPMGGQHGGDQMGQQQMNQQQQMQQMQQQQQQQLQNAPILAPVDMTDFEKRQGDDKKQFVGNSIYPSIQMVYGDHMASIITGMLLDENVVDQRQLVTNNQYFQSKVQEAYMLYASSVPSAQNSAQQQ